MGSLLPRKIDMTFDTVDVLSDPQFRKLESESRSKEMMIDD